METHARVLGWNILSALLDPHKDTLREPEHVHVQHIFIRKDAPDAATKARALLDQARRRNGDFSALVRTHSHDRTSGVYAIANHDVLPQTAEYPRAQLVPAFGDVAFALSPGEVGFVPFDSEKSPLGYHIIKRLR